MSKNPKVSIIIPVYNGSIYMREAIDSALSQTYKNIEIIVINDGSTDDSEKIAKSYGTKIKYYKKENGGVSTALNLGILKMTGEFFSWLSHDDRYYPEKIQIQMDYLIKNKLVNEKVITYTNYDVIDEKSNITNEVHFELYNPNAKPEYALLRGLISGTALLIPKNAFNDYGTFNENYRCIQDYLLFFQFMKTYKYIHIPAVTNSTRIHSKQVTNCNPKVITENNFLWIYMQKNLSNDKKISLEGSIYKFYIEMYKFLSQHNNYLESHKFALQEANKNLEMEQEKLSILLKNKNETYIFNQVNKYYKNSDLGSFKKVDDTIYSIINNIGLDNTISFILANTNLSNKKIISKYKKMLNDYRVNYHNKIYRFRYSLKNEGLLKTLKKAFIKVKSRVAISKLFRKVLRMLYYLRKIVFFIPKTILLFIIES